MMSSSDQPREDSTQVPTTHVTIRPRFRVSDWDSALPAMQQLFDTTQDSSSNVFDWTRLDDQLSWRSTFDDADTMLNYLDTIMPAIESLLEFSSLEKFEVHGPEAELTKIKQQANDLDAEFYDSGSGFQTGYFSQSNKALSQANQQTICSCNPQFSIVNWQSAEPIMEAFMEVTSNEPECLYFGWTKLNDKLFWHADFINGNGLNKHFDQVRPLIDALGGGPAYLEQIEFHGPVGELAKVARESIRGLENHIKYFNTDHRVQRLVQSFEHGHHVV